MDLIDEIKQDLREENIIRLWKQYGNTVISAAIGIIVITAISVAWRAYQGSKHAKLGSSLYAGYEAEHKGDFEQSLASYDELIKKDDSLYSSMAALRKAALLGERGKKDEASEVYKEIAANKSAPKEMRDLAQLYFAYSNVDFANVNNEMTAKVKALAENKKFTFSHSARELLAFMQYGQKNYQAALATFESLAKDYGTPAAMRGRAEEMLNIVKTRLGQ